MLNAIEQVRAARRANTPILAIQTADQPAAQAAAAEVFNATAEPTPLLVWDAVRGLRPVNEAGIAEVKRVLDAKGMKGGLEDLSANTGNINAALDFSQNFAKRTAIMFTAADLFVNDPVTVTGILNLRETFKQDKRTLLLFGAAFELNPALQTSVVVVDEALPGDKELASILEKLVGRSKIEVTDEQKAEAVASVRGLSSFLAEQTFAMSLSKDGLNVAQCWDHKRQAFDQTPGVTLETEGPSFADIKGLAQILKRQAACFGGSNPPAVVVRIDEIDKALAGAALGDTSGTSQAALGYLLQWMEDGGHTGFLAVGPGGSGKSLVSKAVAREFKVPGVHLDIEGTKGSLVGQSGAQIRAALKAIDGLAAGRRVLVVATCNKLDNIPPELRRRFKQGIWFFDLPTADERTAIWTLYLKKNSLKASKPGDLPSGSENWTGAEIRNCVEAAAEEGISLKAAAEFIVPIAKADPDGLRKLRAVADGRFLSASYPGCYTAAESTPAAVTAGGRDLDDGE